MNDRLSIGGNQPPTPVQAAAASAADLAVYLQENPVILSDDDARLAKTFIDRSKASMEELEIARKQEVKPLNDKVANINSIYRAAGQTLTHLLDVLKTRLSTYIRAEEERRAKEIDEARKAASEAERLAEEAKAKEDEAIGNAAVGEATDVGAAVVATDIAFATYAKAERAAVLAERNERVKIHGGFKNALSLRRKEILVLDSWHAALSDMGISDTLEEAILSAARVYKKEYGKLPDGIRSIEEKSL